VNHPQPPEEAALKGFFVILAALDTLLTCTFLDH
jgi:hypothetical protein